MAEEPIKLFSTMSERYPQTNDVDTAQMATRAVISAIPVFGGPVNEVLSLVIAPAVSQRRDDWFKELADVVEEIKGRVENFQPENLTITKHLSPLLFKPAKLHSERIKQRSENS